MQLNVKGSQFNLRSFSVFCIHLKCISSDKSFVSFLRAFSSCCCTFLQLRLRCAQFQPTISGETGAENRDSSHLRHNRWIYSSYTILITSWFVSRFPVPVLWFHVFNFFLLFFTSFQLLVKSHESLAQWYWCEWTTKWNAMNENHIASFSTWKNYAPFRCHYAEWMFRHLSCLRLADSESTTQMA